MKSVRILLLAVMLLPFLSKAQTEQPQKAQKHIVHSLNVHRKSDSLVRGVSFNVFKQSVPGFSDSTEKVVALTAWRLWKHESWRKLDQFFTKDSLNGGWPPNRGGTSLKIVTLQPGALVDRYGGYYTADSVFMDKGTFVSPVGTPFGKRALPDTAINSPYRVYRVIKPITGVKRGGIIPWFNEPGLGIQFQLPYDINDLLKGGYIAAAKVKKLPK